MARNEEKQQGKLNRLWLQREREEGRLRDVHEKRPRLSALTSASSVKKWIPSIKSEIEYYLQQSQLTHYPERKIAQFQLHIQALEREYKSFISKLRALDPTCKHTPWTPRAYCKRRADPQDGPSRVKSLRLCETPEAKQNERDPESTTGSETGSDRTSDSERTLVFKTGPVSGTSEGVCADQDQPLSFDRTKLAVAVAAFKGPVSQLGSSQTQSLARALQSGLPNLMTSSHSSSSQSKDSLCDEGLALVSDQRSRVLDRQSDCEAAERNSVSKTTERSAHVLGLGCYSSSSDDEVEPEDS
ncbi:uncharacterized protein LOC141788609 [Halichoeres trimaculatus]|uniref:uncharacterized protein LOC141788609 n=1 Tax=Halichoeres trimaculatus TaxID=147232 RepID=UPI003D9DE587